MHLAAACPTNITSSDTVHSEIRTPVEVDERILFGDYKTNKAVNNSPNPWSLEDSISKLRSSIGGVYAWRLATTKNSAEKERMLKEADFAFRQAFTLAPRNPEGFCRYASLLAGEKRFDDAILVVGSALKLDPENPALPGLLDELKRMKGNIRTDTQSK